MIDLLFLHSIICTVANAYLSKSYFDTPLRRCYNGAASNRKTPAQRTTPGSLTVSSSTGGRIIAGVRGGRIVAAQKGAEVVPQVE